MRISLEQAAALLQKGEVVGVPTETVYGLAASVEQPAAISRIFSLKNRPADNPLIVHLAEASQVFDFVEEVPEGFLALADEFWPGPLTLVIPVIEGRLVSEVRAGLSTAAFRVPGYLLTRELLMKTGPLVMPSANISGKPSATAADHVETDFGRDFPVMDGGRCGEGVESTILIFQQEGGWVVGRLGAIPAKCFAPLLGYVPKEAKKGDVPLCPGQRYRHYAPRAKLHFGPVEGYSVVLGYGEREYPGAEQVIVLGSINDPASVAEELYAALRHLDEEGIVAAWVDVDVPQEGLWLTIIDRLYKASTPSRYTQTDSIICF